MTRIVQVFLLAMLAPVLVMDQRPLPLVLLFDERVAFVTADGVDNSLLEAVRELPATTRALAIDRNYGGFELPAVEIAEILRLRQMEVYVAGECDSACTTLLQGATIRSAERSAIFIVHALQPGPNDTDVDGQRRYDAQRLVALGLDPAFAATYIARDSGEKELTAEEALAVGLVTDLVNGGCRDSVAADRSGCGITP